VQDGSLLIVSCSVVDQHTATEQSSERGAGILEESAVGLMTLVLPRIRECISERYIHPGHSQDNPGSKLHELSIFRVADGSRRDLTDAVAHNFAEAAGILQDVERPLNQ
jgi:hypothetical protein